MPTAHVVNQQKGGGVGRENPTGDHNKNRVEPAWDNGRGYLDEKKPDEKKEWQIISCQEGEPLVKEQKMTKKKRTPKTKGYGTTRLEEAGSQVDGRKKSGSRQGKRNIQPGKKKVKQYRTSRLEKKGVASTKKKKKNGSQGPTGTTFHTKEKRRGQEQCHKAGNSRVKKDRSKYSMGERGGDRQKVPCHARGMKRNRTKNKEGG